MAADKYTAVWTSHTSISDFLDCPRAYFYKHVYKDPKTNNKIKLMSPYLALGQSVHEVLESLSNLPTNERFKEPLMSRFDRVWEKVTGKKGGFYSAEQEKQFKERGKEMLRHVYNHPGPIGAKAVKIQKDLPYFWLSEEENIILCGKIDWLEYLEETDSVHIIDFKTGKKKESESSLQLPIYHLLVHNCQKRKVDRASYWYLETDNILTEKELPSLEGAKEKILNIARKMKLARQIKKFECPSGVEGCRSCNPLEAVVAGKAEFVGTDEFRYDTYILSRRNDEEEEESVLL